MFGFHHIEMLILDTRGCYFMFKNWCLHLNLELGVFFALFFELFLLCSITVLLFGLLYVKYSFGCSNYNKEIKLN